MTFPARFAARRPYTVLVLACLLLFLPGLFTLPPSDRDESRFAQATKQMLETGDYVRIMNGAEPRNRKPIGIHWLQLPFAAAARATGLARAVGNPIWPYRLPSALGALAAVLLTYGLGRRLVGRTAALLAALMLACCMLVTTEAHIAKTDAALLGATTLGMGMLGRAYLAPAVFERRHAALFWLATGAGVLLKGPITPAVAGLAALALLIADRRVGWLAALRARWGVPLLLATVLPWFVAIGLATHGRFFHDAVGGDLGRKLAGGDDAHGAPPGFHLLLLPLLAFPASIPVLRGAAASWRGRGRPETRFLLAWAAPSWGLFEAVPTKLPHYTLPLYPALMLLGASWLLDPARRPGPRWWRVAARALFAAAAAVVGIAAAALPLALGAPFWLGLPGLAAAALIAAVVLRRPDGARPTVAALLLSPLLYWSVLGFELPRLTPLWIAPRVAAALASHWPGGRPADAGFGAVGFHEPSLMFLAGTDTAWLATGSDGADFLADNPDRVVAVGDRDQASFAAEAARRGLAPHAFATVSGVNYSRGRRMTLTLYAR